MLERTKDQIEEAARRRTADLILELDLTGPLVEGVPHDPVSAVLARRKAVLGTILDGLHRAGRDRRVRALVVKVGGPRSTLAPAWAQELREAVQAFRNQGKLAVAWAETFGELGQGSVPYYLATAFDEVWLQPSGDLCLTGVAAEVPFLRGALDKVGIAPQFAQRHEYKNAANMFTEQRFTEAHREATERLVHSVMDQMVTDIATGRGLEVAEVRALVDRAPLFASEAMEAGLVDRLGYRDEVYAALQDQVGTDAALRYLGRYGQSKVAKIAQRVSHPAREKLALVHVTGAIHLGKSGRRGLSPDGAGSDTVTTALQAATKAPDVKAIVLRVASPGGSYVASDAIWRQVALTRQAGKPVIVSMGDVAASGGYFVSMGADVIVAEPATITGSIGVLAGKPVISGLLQRIGVTHERVVGAKHGLMSSTLQEFSESEWERLNVWLDRIYHDFIAKAAEGRQLGIDLVDEVARGRVWSGADAHERGLVDQLGGLDAAKELAKERAGIPAGVEPELITYPRMPLASRLRPARSSDDLDAEIASGQLRLDAWGSFADLAAALGLPNHGPLMLPNDLRLR